MGKDLTGRELGPGLSQRKDGMYSAKFVRKNRARKEKTFKKLPDAREWLGEQRHIDKMFQNGDMTVEEWYQYWLVNFKIGIVSENTVKNYQNRYKVNIRAEIGALKLTEVKKLHCQKIINNMFDSNKYAYGTIELTQITMHAIFKGAIENEYLLKNPAEGLLMKQVEEREERRVFTVDEEEMFKVYAEGTLYDFAYFLALETGLRQGEIGGLKWEDINFEKKELSVRRTLLQRKKKDEESGFYFGKPKTKKSRRNVPLTEEAIDILNKQKIKQKKMEIRSSKWDADWNGLVFTTTNGKPVGASTFNNMIARIIQNINLDRKAESENGKYEVFEHAYMHAFRHTFATRCIESGMQPKVLQKILGHSTLSVTMDLYVHVLEDVGHSEIAKLEKARKKRKDLKADESQKANIVLISRAAPGHVKVKEA